MSKPLGPWVTFCTQCVEFNPWRPTQSLWKRKKKVWKCSRFCWTSKILATSICAIFSFRWWSRITLVGNTLLVVRYANKKTKVNAYAINSLLSGDHSFLSAVVRNVGACSRWKMGQRKRSSIFTRFRNKAGIQRVVTSERYALARIHTYSNHSIGWMQQPRGDETHYLLAATIHTGTVRSPCSYSPRETLTSVHPPDCASITSHRSAAHMASTAASLEHRTPKTV